MNEENKNSNKPVNQNDIFKDFTLPMDLKELDLLKDTEASCNLEDPFEIEDDYSCIDSCFISNQPKKYKATDISLPNKDFRFLGTRLIIAGNAIMSQLEAYQMCLEYPGGDLQIQSDFKARNISSKDITNNNGNTYMDIKIDFIGSPCNASVEKYYCITYLSYIKDSKREYVKFYIYGECANGHVYKSEGFITEISQSQMQAELQRFKQCEEKAELVTAIANYMGVESFGRMQDFLNTKNIDLSGFDFKTLTKNTIQTIGQISKIN